MTDLERLENRILDSYNNLTFLMDQPQPRYIDINLTIVTISELGRNLMRLQDLIEKMNLR